jgi:elongation factor G
MSAGIRNFAVLAHVDAGKTTVAERILFTAHEISSCGDVDEGLATMDYLTDEKEKGITIETGVHSYVWKGASFTFLDTPGHVDFGAEVDQALDAVDVAVLVVSGVKGIQTRTLSSWDNLQKHQVPGMLFINKLDVPGIELETVLIDLELRFEKPVLYLNYPWFEDGTLKGCLDVLGNVMLVQNEEGRETQTQPVPPALESLQKRLYKDLVEAAADVDDEIAQAFLQGSVIEMQPLVQALNKSFMSHITIPCYMGSALKNIGIRQLMTGLHLFSSQNTNSTREKNAWGQIIEYRIAPDLTQYYLFKNFVQANVQNIPSHFTFWNLRAGELAPVQQLLPNMIVAMSCSNKAYKTGDVLDTRGEVLRNRWNETYRPLLQTRIESQDAQSATQLGALLHKLELADPSLRIEYNENEGNWTVFTVGEVQRDVLLNRMKRDYKCEFTFGEPQPDSYEIIHEPIEKVSIELHSLHGVYSISAKILFDKNAPSPVVEWQENVTQYMQSVEQSSGVESLGMHMQDIVTQSIQEAALHGVIGSAQGLRSIRFVVMELQLAMPVLPGVVKKMILDLFKMKINPKMVTLYEPQMEIEVEVNQEFAGKILADLEHRKARVEGLNSRGDQTIITALLPLRNTFGYNSTLRSFSRGTATMQLRYKGFSPVVNS